MAVAFPGSPPLLSVPLSLLLPPCTTLTSQHIPGKVCSVLFRQGSHRSQADLKLILHQSAREPGRRHKALRAQGTVPRAVALQPCAVSPQAVMTLGTAFGLLMFLSTQWTLVIQSEVWPRLSSGSSPFHTFLSQLSPSLLSFIHLSSLPSSLPPIRLLFFSCFESASH